MQITLTRATTLLAVAVFAGCGGDGKDRQTPPTGDTPALCDTPLCQQGPGGGGGLTVSKKLQVVDIPADATDLVFDPGTQKLYISVAGTTSAVLPVDPASGGKGTAIPVGSLPSKLALSGDNAFLYVGGQGQSNIQRIDLATQTIVLTIPLPPDPFSGPTFVEDMEVMPGNPKTIAVSLQVHGRSPKHAGVAAFDDATQRPVLLDGIFSNNRIEFGATTDTLYGLNGDSTEFGFSTMVVAASGVTETGRKGGLIDKFNIEIKFAGGLIYATDGKVIDPVAGTLVRTHAIPSHPDNQVVPDVALNRVFYLTNDVGKYSIQAFNITTGVFIAAEPIEDDPLTTAINESVRGFPVNMVRFGANGLAFITDEGQLFLVGSSVLFQ